MHAEVKVVAPSNVKNLLTQRILARPFDADPYLKDLLDDTLVRRHSVVQRIWRSPVLSEWLKSAIKEHGGSRANLHAAKHRFESYATPLGVMLQELDQFLDVAQKIGDQRQGSKEHGDFVDWLRGLDEERLVQLGMIADCSDEMLVSTREVDDENVDTSKMHDAIQGLLCRLDALFNKKACLKLPGYTKHVIDTLKKQRLVFVGGQDGVRSIGGRNLDEALRHCLSRMSAYTALVADVASTEFPDFELFCSFKIFNLEHANRNRSLNNEESDIALQRLAQALNVNLAALEEQYHRMRQCALQKLQDCPDIGNKAAWQLAVRHTKPCAAKADGKWKLDALLPVLWRYVGWTAATSGVEQNFSKALRAIGPQRGSLTDEHEELALRLTVYKPDKQEKALIVANARCIWANHYGAPRQQSGAGRCDRGVLRPNFSTRSAVSWLRTRRAAAREAGILVGDASGLSAAAGAGWTEGHDKERTFQAKKRQKKEIQALADGFLLPGEVQPELHAALVERTSKDAKADAEAKRAHRKRQLMNTRAKLNLKAGMAACISAPDDGGLLVAMLTSKGLRLEDELSVNTQVLIVADPSNLTKQQKWTAALVGLLVCSPASVLGDSGPFLKYKPAVYAGQRLHLTDAFKAKHVGLTKLLKDACGLQRSTLKLARNDSGKKVVVLGGNRPKSRKASKYLKSIMKIVRHESRAR